jgi:DNA-binding transcriptional regulator YhcF (GntR family)
VRLWFSPSSEVPLYKQLVTQVVLAVLAGDLKPGDKLPSTRELARRFAIHPNTISAGYRELERDGWTETRHGSGVYVRDHAVQAKTPQQAVDVAIASFFRMVRELGLPMNEVRARVAEWIAAPPPDHFLVVDSDAEMRKILMTEIADTTKFPVREASVEECADAELLKSVVPVCRPSQEERVRASLPMGVELLTLQISSATAWLTPYLPAPKGHLFAVVSCWSEFLLIARTMLAAAGVPGDALIFCDANKRGWQRGVEQASALLCDAATAKQKDLPRGPRVLVFRLLSDATREMLARCAA